MSNVHLVILILVYLLLPAGVIALCNKVRVFNKIGNVIIVYALGLLLGNIGILPTASEMYNAYYNLHGALSSEKVQHLLQIGLINQTDVLVNNLRHAQDLFISVSIALALPLLLFSSNIRLIKKLAPMGIRAFLTGILSVILVIITGFFIFRNHMDLPVKKISGMLVGLYTGGTPNLAALKLMLHVNPDIYIITHTYDTLISSLYLLFLITVGHKFFERILGKRRSNVKKAIRFDAPPALVDKISFKNKKHITVGVLISLGITGISAGISSLVKESNQMLVAILLITTLGLVLSIVPKINRLENTFSAGMYFILVFSFVVASMANIKSFTSESVVLLLFISYVVVITLALHLVLAKIFKIRSGILIVASTALICSPPFVPVVAGAIKNKAIIPIGLAIGILGYAVGNYLGVLFTFALEHFF